MIRKERQINLKPGLEALALKLDNGGIDENHLEELRGLVRVLSGLAVCFHGAFENDEKVLEKEFDHLVADVHDEQKHPDAEHHNRVVADLGAMIGTILNMADDNVIAVSATDCARIFSNALTSAEDILKMPKPPKTYRNEALGMINAVCQLMHPDSCFGDSELHLISSLGADLRTGKVRAVHTLRTHLERIG